MFKRILVIVLSILSISCTTAKKASEINAVRPPIAPYLKLRCFDKVEGYLSRL